MTNLEKLIEAGNPNGNTLAEIYANIRDKALEEAARACARCAKDSDGNDLRQREWKHAFQHCADMIRTMKKYPHG